MVGTKTIKCLFFLIVIVSLLLGCYAQTPSSLTPNIQVVSATPSRTVQVTSSKTDASNTPVVSSLTPMLVIPEASQTPMATSIADVSNPLAVTWQKTAIKAHAGPYIVPPITNPSWSHDGSMVAYTYRGSIWVVETVTWQKPQEVCRLGSQDTLGSLFGDFATLLWSLDDSTIATVVRASSDDQHLDRHFPVQCNLATGEWGLLIDLTANENVTLIYDWGEEGVLLDIVDSEKRHRPFLVNLDKGERRELQLPGIQEGQTITNIKFLDEKQLIYMLPSNFNLIYVVNLDDSSISEIIDSSDQDEFYPYMDNVAPSPDGRWLIWVEESNTATDTDVYLLKIYDRSNKEFVDLFHSESLDYDEQERFWSLRWSLPSWSPDSKQLVFMTDQHLWLLQLEFVKNP